MSLDLREAIRIYAQLAVDDALGSLARSDGSRLAELKTYLLDSFGGSSEPEMSLGDGESAIEFLDAALADGRAQALSLEPAPGLEELGVNARDRNKIRGLRLEAASSYTAPVRALHLKDYYGDEVLTMKGAGGQTPTSVRAADGSRASLNDEALLFFGLKDPPRGPRPRAPRSSAAPPKSTPPEAPSTQLRAPTPVSEPPVAPKRPSSEPTARISLSAVDAASRSKSAARTSVAPTRRSTAAPPRQSVPPPRRQRPSLSQPPAAPKRTRASRAPVRQNAEIHLMDDRTFSCEVKDFDPSSGVVRARGVEDGTPLSFEVEDLKRIDFVTSATSPPTGAKRLQVTLVDGSRIVGWSADYTPGVMWIHVFRDSDEEHRTVVWVPAWAVRAIEMRG